MKKITTAEVDQFLIQLPESTLGIFIKKYKTNAEQILNSIVRIRLI